MDSKPPGPVLVHPTEGSIQSRILRDRRGQQYQPAIGPRMKALLFMIFAAVAMLGATGVYLVAIDAFEKFRAQSYTNQFTLSIFMVHVVIGVLLVIPFLIFGFTHLASAMHRKNRRAVRLGVLLFVTSIVVGISGIALIQIQASFHFLGWQIQMPQMPTGTTLRLLTYTLHAVAPLVAVVLYVLHRRAGPDIQWKWGIAWGTAVTVFVGAMVIMHSQDPRKWYAKGSPEGERYFEPSKTRTVDGNFIPEEALMMDQYCLKCHQDVYNGWFHSAHHFSSFNNPAYLFSVRETRKVTLERDGEMRGSRWCAGCHDPVPFLSGQFDNPKFDDVHHPTSQAGITCTVCHAMVNVNSRMGNGDYTIEEPQHYPFAYSDNAVLQWMNHQTVKAKPDFHKKTFLKPFHRQEAFCSTCHKVSLPLALNHYKEFLRGQNHSDTFLLSGVSGHGARSFYYPPSARVNCAECHMPLKGSLDFGSKDFDQTGNRKIHDHFFPAANTGLMYLLSEDATLKGNQEGLQQALQKEADFLRGSGGDKPSPNLRIDLFGLKPGGKIDGKLIAPLRPELPALEPGRKYLVEVVIRTLGLGHPFTQGTADSNEIWVDFSAQSNGRTFGRSGGLEKPNDAGRVDEWAHFVNMLLLDRNGNRIDRRNPQDIFTPLYNHQIPPGAAQVVHYELEVPGDITGPVELKVRLRYRKFDYTYMELVYGKDKVPRLPVIDLCEDQVILPVQGIAKATAAQSSTIRPPWQRWNDYGIGCLLEGGVETKKGELKQAEEAFRHLLSDSDKGAHSHGHLNLARVYYAQGRLNEAVEALNAGRTDEPPAPWWTVAWFTGLVNSQNGHLDQAIENFKQILDPNLQPRKRKFDFTKDYVVIDELAKTLFQRSQIEEDNPTEREQYLREAIERLEEVLAIDNEDIDAHYWLSQSFSRLGRISKETLEATATAAIPDGETLVTLGSRLAGTKEGRSQRLQAASQLVKALELYGRQATDPIHPKLPIINRLIDQCLSVYRQASDAELNSAAAAVLGQLHRLAHAIYKPDDNAQDRAIAIYRKAHPAAAHASQAIVIYPTNRSEVLSLK